MRIWDFDGVIFHSGGDYSDRYLTENLHNKALVATLPPLTHWTWDRQHTETDWLITGRSSDQQLAVREILEYNNLHFDGILYGPFSPRQYNHPQFKDLFYRPWKIDAILEFAEAPVDVVIDDDDVVCAGVASIYPVIHVPRWQFDLREIVARGPTLEFNKTKCPYHV
jgi:hypothetical protein